MKNYSILLAILLAGSCSCSSEHKNKKANLIESRKALVFDYAISSACDEFAKKYSVNERKATVPEVRQLLIEKLSSALGGEKISFKPLNVEVRDGKGASTICLEVKMATLKTLTVSEIASNFTYETKFYVNSELVKTSAGGGP